MEAIRRLFGKRHKPITNLEGAQRIIISTAQYPEPEGEKKRLKKLKELRRRILADVRREKAEKKRSEAKE